jgi:hypothetical protein
MALTRPFSLGFALPYRLAHEASSDRFGRIRTVTVLALSALQIAFIALVGTMTALAGLFALYVLIQQFRNPFRR